MNKPAVIPDIQIKAAAQSTYRNADHDQPLAVKALQQAAFRAGARWALETAGSLANPEKDTAVR